MGVTLPSYQGYNAKPEPGAGHEFASTGYRAHSQIHGELEIRHQRSAGTARPRWTRLRRRVSRSPIDGDEVELAVPLNVGVLQPRPRPADPARPPTRRASAREPQYKNDEQIDNQLRSVLFRCRSPATRSASTGRRCRSASTAWWTWVPSTSSVAETTACRATTRCATPSGCRRRPRSPLSPVSRRRSFPSDPLLTPGNEINDPNSLDIIALFDADGNPTTVEADNAVRMVRRTTVGRQAQGNLRLGVQPGRLHRHDRRAASDTVPSSASCSARSGGTSSPRARDGDRFFYLNDPLQSFIRKNFGIDYRRTLAQVIAANTDIPLSDLEANVFRVPPRRRPRRHP